MDHGKVLELDTPAALIRGLDAGVRISLEPGAIGVDDARGLPGVDSVEADPSAVLLATRRPAEVLAALAARDSLAGLQVKGATLEDVFLTLTGREYRA
jgi:ABC-2 type transport system ATP-binding protein